MRHDGSPAKTSEKPLDFFILFRRYPTNHFANGIELRSNIQSLRYLETRIPASLAYSYPSRMTCYSDSSFET